MDIVVKLFSAGLLIWFALLAMLITIRVLRGDIETIGLLTESAGSSVTPERVVAVAEAAPTDLEGRAVVRRFLENYLIYTPDSVDRNFAEALNMMTSNLRSYTLSKLRDDDTEGKVKVDYIISDFRVRSLEHVKNTPWTFMVFGVKEVHRLKNRQETSDHIVGRYSVRLAFDRRSEYNASGLLVADYWEQQMVGEKNTGLEQTDDLAREATRK